VLLLGLSLRAEAIAGYHEECAAIRAESHPAITRSHPAGALEVEADLDAGRMKTLAPIQRVGGLHLVPFKAETIARKAAGQLTPKRAHAAPEGLFAA